MRYSLFTLADAVTVREGLVNVLSAGITNLRRDEYPARLDVWLAAAVEVSPEDLASCASLEFELLVLPAGSDTPAHRIAGRWHDLSSVKTDGFLPIQLSMPLDLRAATIDKPGNYCAVLKFTGLDDVELRFTVAPSSNTPEVAELA